jgi:hypothetical protein
MTLRIIVFDRPCDFSKSDFKVVVSHKPIVQHTTQSPTKQALYSVRSLSSSKWIFRGFKQIILRIRLGHNPGVNLIRLNSLEFPANGLAPTHQGQRQQTERRERLFLLTAGKWRRPPLSARWAFVDTNGIWSIGAVFFGGRILSCWHFAVKEECKGAGFRAF